MKNHFQVACLLFPIVLVFCQSVNAQQWGGSGTTTGLISRNGNIFSGNNGFQLNIDTGTRAIELIGSTGNIFDMRSSAYSGAFLIAQGSTSVGFNSDFPLQFNLGHSGSPLLTAMQIQMNGHILINKTSQTDTTYFLDVNGTTRVNGLVVNTTGADFVFDSAYHLPSLAAVEDFIRQYHHLPGIVPAATMQQKGLDVGDNQMHLLQKVEELTLYAIEQQRRISELEAKLERIESLLKDKK